MESLTNEVSLLQGLGQGSSEDIARLIGVCTAVCANSNDGRVCVFAIRTLDVACSSFSVNFVSGQR
jgi:hypothetical protein